MLPSLSLEALASKLATNSLALWLKAAVGDTFVLTTLMLALLLAVAPLSSVTVRVTV